jgi:prefoldin alpha subunit
MEQDNQELIFKLSMMEQQIQQIQQQLQIVEQGIIELGGLNLGLDELIGKEGQEILAPIGKGIFTKAKLISEELLVDIGDKKFVTKSIPDTKEMIKKQIIKLDDVKKQLENALEELSAELTKTLKEAEGSFGEGSCTCGEHCGCEDECDEDCSCDKEKGCKCGKH